MCKVGTIYLGPLEWDCSCLPHFISVMDAIKLVPVKLMCATPLHFSGTPVGTVKMFKKVC